MRKKLDSRIRTLIEKCVARRERCIFAIVGDNGRDQVVNLHYILSKSLFKARPTVLWCYKNELYLSSHRKKRLRQVKKLMQRGLIDPEQEDPFTLFVASTTIRYCYYADSHKILGNTFGMCILQDFEALTPNLLARTIETVEGGGMVVLLLSSMESLTKLYDLTMDVHSRMRTEAHQEIKGRFNERLILSLTSNHNCIFMDDNLNILPTSSFVKELIPADGESVKTSLLGKAPAEELKSLTESLVDMMPAGPLVARCRTLDQAKAVLTFMEAISEKSLRSIVALTAARGRGKSASLGLAIAGAVATGYSNIFVTAPSPENLRTLFEFILQGLDGLDYKEHIDYDLEQSSNVAFNKALVRVNIYKHHRQTIQYIQPQHYSKLIQAELLVIDEAAAIPLSLVKTMLGPYLIFLCSTINGYEGTGRSLSLKLLQQLRSGKNVAGNKAELKNAHRFQEVQLQEPIRYAEGDPLELWLHEILCLNAAEHLQTPPSRLPHPNECDLYYVERDTLLSFHKVSELFLQHTVALLVSSHYRNSPNDLLMMSDAPAHHIYVLTGPVSNEKDETSLPTIFCVIQLALEGAISQQAATKNLARGNLPAGDLIPWTVAQQFQETDFPKLSGARIVRIAVHPDLQCLGYGLKAVQLLHHYFQGDLVSQSFGHNNDTETGHTIKQQSDQEGGTPKAGPLLSEKLLPRTNLPPLLTSLAERKPEQVQWLGVSYGLTQQLLNFWKRCRFLPVYLRQSASEITGECTMIMMTPVHSAAVEGTAWLDTFVQDFKVRFLSLLAGPFRGFSPGLALSILDPKLSFTESEARAAITADPEVVNAGGLHLSPHDLKRLQAYTNNLVDYHMILDLIPCISRALFSGRIPATLSYAQAAIFLCFGLQHIEVSDAEKYLELPSNQILALFNKGVRKLYQQLQAAREVQVGTRMRPLSETEGLPPPLVAEEKKPKDAESAVEAFNVTPELEKYSVAGLNVHFEDQLDSHIPPSGVISIPKQDSKKAGHKLAEPKGNLGKRRHRAASQSRKSRKA